MIEIAKINGYTYYITDGLRRVLKEAFIKHQEEQRQKNTPTGFSNPTWYVPEKADTQKRQTEGED
jgi:hypothetical protein